MTTKSSQLVSKKPVVRGIDVGYGHVKLTLGRDRSNTIEATSFPSQAPTANDIDLHAEFLMRPDTFRVPVNGRLYEVGRQVNITTSSNQELEQLDDQFPLSDGYTARLYGALNYMMPGLGEEKEIDMLVLGLPMNTLTKHKKALEEKFRGEHEINTKGDRIKIANCKVHAQPLGSYAYFVEDNPDLRDAPPMTLIVDPGYNTVDWFVCQGLVPNPGQSKAVNRGVSAYLREVAKSINKAHSDYGVSETEIVRMLDRHLIGDETFQLASDVIDLTPHWKAGDPVIEQACQAIRDSVGSGGNIRLILITGGGAKLYEQRIREKYPKHRVEVIANSNLANVRGFHVIGQWTAASAMRASTLASRGG